MSWIDFIMRILLSMLLGFLIGLERQITGHTAWIRINLLISMGSRLFLMFPIIFGSDEVFRIASSIVSGVGFLCSGVIFKDGETVRELNTAARNCTPGFKTARCSQCRMGGAVSEYGYRIWYLITASPHGKTCRRKKKIKLKFCRFAATSGKSLSSAVLSF